MSPGKKVLLYDPESRLSEYLGNFIPLLGDFELISCRNCLEILSKNNALNPALIIADDDGASAELETNLREIRSARQNVPFLILSGDGTKKIQAGFYAEDFAPKTCSLSELSEKIKKKLGVGIEKDFIHEFARLLVADDETEMVDLLKDIFCPLGIEVHTASDGQEAMTVFSKRNCNLVIVDLTMPEMNGVEVIRKLQSGFAPPKAVILITASLGSTVHELRRLGYPVMAKPIDLDMLEKNILAACQKYGLELKN
jgi:DNA-binding NtrC family response regulator